MLQSFVIGVFCAGLGLTAFAGQGREVFWPDAQPKVEAGDGVRLERNGDEMAVFVETCPDVKWPAAYFTFPAPRDITYASLIPVLDQKARGRAYANYVFSAVDNPNYVGANWFCWRDCPLTGQLAEGANAQCGLVSTTDIPYDELVKAMREVSSTMYRRRYGEAK